MIIRKFDSHDLEAVLEIFCNAVHFIGSKYYNQKQVNAWAPKKELDQKKWLESLTKNISYVAEEKGAVIAFGDMTFAGYIDHLFVHKSYQGSGASVRIFRELEKDAKKMGIKQLTCDASIMLKPLAERHGFQWIEKQSKTLRGEEFIIYKMYKELN